MTTETELIEDRKAAVGVSGGRADSYTRWIGPVGALTSGILLWYLAALIANIPTPHAVLIAAIDLMALPSTYVDIGHTLRRVLIGFFGGVLLGGIVGVLMGLVPWIQGLLKPWVVILLSIPGPVAVIAAILVLGLGEAPTLTALVLSVMPFVANIMMGAVGSLDQRLEGMSQVFGASASLHWREVILPQLAPSAFAAVQTAFSLSWKLVVVIEAISASRGIGVAMLRSFRTLQPAPGIAWAGTFTVFMVLVDVLIFKTIERRVFRWRVAAQWS